MGMYINGRPLPGLSISGRDTYNYWEMIPTSRLHVVPPEVKTNYVDLPGADGGLDYTELLTGSPNYGYRKGSWEFMLIPGEMWASVYQDLCSYLHGKHHQIILQDDSNYYYTGRLTVNEWTSSPHNSLITIDYVLDPERKAVSENSEADQDAADLLAAGRLLRKSANVGKIIKMDSDTPVIVSPEDLFYNYDSMEF